METNKNHTQWVVEILGCEKTKLLPAVPVFHEGYIIYLKLNLGSLKTSESPVQESERERR